MKIEQKFTPPTHQKDLAGSKYMGTIDIRLKQVSQPIVISTLALGEGSRYLELKFC